MNSARHIFLTTLYYFINFCESMKSIYSVTSNYVHSYLYNKKIMKCVIFDKKTKKIIKYERKPWSWREKNPDIQSKNSNIIACSFYDQGMLYYVITDKVVDEEFLDDFISKSDTYYKKQVLYIFVESQTGRFYDLLPFVTDFKASLFMNETMVCEDVVHVLTNFHGSAQFQIDFTNLIYMLEADELKEGVNLRSDILRLL